MAAVLSARLARSLHVCMPQLWDRVMGNIIATLVECNVQYNRGCVTHLAGRASGSHILSYQWPVSSVECRLDTYSADSNPVYYCMPTAAVSTVNDYNPAHQTARCAVRSASVSCRAGILTYYITLRTVVYMT